MNAEQARRHDAAMDALVLRFNAHRRLQSSSEASEAASDGPTEPAQGDGPGPEAA